MSHAPLALAAYLLDRFFGEFPLTHPVVWMGRYIAWFERVFYADSVFRGGILTLSLLAIVGGIVSPVSAGVAYLPEWAGFAVIALLASTGLAFRMLGESVRGVLASDDPKAAVAMLVSRDTAGMSESDVNKALVETYAENLSDGVVAPLFWLLVAGLPGIALYKAVNTLDSMVGYRTARYERFGKVSARLDDLLNWIPARLTLLLILSVSFSRAALRAVRQSAAGHESPNAGYPIAAMAGAVGVALGGPTSYDGKVKNKPFFGEGRREITRSDVHAALRLGAKIDGLLVIILLILAGTEWLG